MIEIYQILITEANYHLNRADPISQTDEEYYSHMRRYWLLCDRMVDLGAIRSNRFSADRKMVDIN